MKILSYNELEIGKVKKQFAKTVQLLEKGDFKSADVKKMIGTGYYRAKLDDTNRLLFKFAKYGGETCLLLMEVILNHEYEKSRFLNGAAVDESKLSPLADGAQVPASEIETLRFANPKKGVFHLLDKIICFDEAQREIYEMPVPVVIIGSAGSGKTALTLEKLKQLNGNVAYISLSPYLVESARNIYYANRYENEGQDIDFLTFQEYLQSIRIPQGKEIAYRDFFQWFLKHIHHTKISEPYRLYEEFKGVLTGSVTDAAYLSKADYLALGVKQSIFTASQREEIYGVFEKYLSFLKEGGFYDTNMLSFEYMPLVQPVYDFVVIDEVQDITNVQLSLILKSLKDPAHFMLSGDSNQIVHPNFFSWSKVKSLFFKSDFDFSLIRILKTNYRNSQKVTALSNQLLRIKNMRFGSIDKESNFLIDAVSDSEGEVLLLNNDKKMLADLNAKTGKSARYAVLVMNEKDKGAAKSSFNTPLVFSIQEAKGLEYENIILYDFVSGYEKEFTEITKGVEAADLDEELKYNRAKSKEDKDLEVYKFFINALYVAFTRSVKNLYLIEGRGNHRVFELLGMKESNEKIKIVAQQSDTAEWLEEARKLDLQGKHEQAQQIRDRISGIAYISKDDYLALQALALDPSKTEKEVGRERKDLFGYASARKHVKIVAKLAELGLQRAVLYMKEVKADQKVLAKASRLDRTGEIKKIVEKYGVDFVVDDAQNSALTVAAEYGALESMQYLIKLGANLSHKNSEGRTPLQAALRSTYLFSFAKDAQFQVCTLPLLAKTYKMLKPPYIKCAYQNRMRLVHDRTMEFFLINILSAVQDLLLEHKEKEWDREAKIRIAKYSFGRDEREEFLSQKEEFFKKEDISVDDLLPFFEMLPESILPDFRKKRSYILSVLSQHEVDRDFIYNKQIFKRTSRGHYVLNPDMIAGWEELEP